MSYIAFFSQSIVMQDVCCPSMRMFCFLTSYHLARSVATAILRMPRVSYISCNASAISTLGIAFLYGSICLTILIIFSVSVTVDTFTSSLLMSATLYLRAFTLDSPRVSYAVLTRGLCFSISICSAVENSDLAAFSLQYALNASLKLVFLVAASLTGLSG